jgi:hypothetical protein
VTWYKQRAFAVSGRDIAGSFMMVAEAISLHLMMHIRIGCTFQPLITEQ